MEEHDNNPENSRASADAHDIDTVTVPVVAPENNTTVTTEVDAPAASVATPETQQVMNIPEAQAIGSVPTPVVSSFESGAPRTIYGLSVSDLKGLLVKTMLGCLIVAAVVAVVAILVGSMTDTAWRAVGTIVSAIIHIMIVFAVISIATPKANAPMRRSTNFFANAVLAIAIVSFFSSVLNIWDVINSELAGKLDVTYIVAFISLLHTKTLMDVKFAYDRTKWYVYANYGFIALVAALILGLVYSGNGITLLEGFYGRLLAASAIIDVTLSSIAAVMLRLYAQKHPEIGAVTGHTSVGRVILIILAVVGSMMLIWPIILFLMFMGAFAR